LQPLIHIADDELIIRKFVSKTLSSAGYWTLEAEGGLAAYELIRELNTDLKLAIVDIRMPRMNGVELTERLRTEYPDIKILCISGYSNEQCPKAHCFLAKPFGAKAL